MPVNSPSKIRGGRGALMLQEDLSYSSALMGTSRS